MSPRLPRRGVVLLAGAVVVAVGVTTVGAVARPTEQAPAQAVTVPVASSVRVCPASPAPPSPTATQPLPADVVVTAATFPQVALPGPASGGAVTLSSLSGAATPLISLTAPAAQGTYTPKASTGVMPPTALRGTGSLAPGASATQVRYVPSGGGRSLVGQTCPEPTGNAWFLGGSGAPGHVTTVELDNPDATPAVADVVVWGPRGLVVSPAGRGVNIPGRGQATLRLDVLAPGVSPAGVHVILRAGRAAVTVTDVQSSGLLGRGSDVVPTTSAPVRRLVIPGVPGGQKGTRTLELLAPGDQNALVRVQVIGRDGRFTPDELAALDVPAGKVIQAPVTSQVGDGSVGLLLTSDMPIIAAVRNVLPSKASTPDVTFSAATPALAGPVLAAGLRAGTKPGTGWASRLFLAAPSTDSRADVTLLGSDGSTTTTTVSVTGGTSTELLLKGPASFALLLTPAAGSGPVFGAVELDYTDSSGLLSTAWPLVASSLTDTLPPVREDPALGVPGS